MTCSAYKEAPQLVCANGFVQVLRCRIASDPCAHCGEPRGPVPYCLRDELPKQFTKDDGSPFFHRPEAAQ